MFSFIFVFVDADLDLRTKFGRIDSQPFFQI